jgi:transcriptional regulator with XRE-family HTH domain
MGTKTARLEEIRQELRLNKSQFARAMGIDPHYYYGILQGKGKANLRMEHVERLMDYANVNPVWLLTGEGEKYVNQEAPTADEPSIESVEALYKHLQQGAAESPTLTHEYLLKTVCARVLMEYPKVKSLDMLAMLASVYLNVMTRMPDINVAAMLGVAEEVAPYMKQEKTEP